MANKVYTKKGDDGTTSLLSGTRLYKTNKLIRAVGALDELNSFIGLLRSEIHGGDPSLEIIQWNLFNAGATVINDNNTKITEIIEEDTKVLESYMDKMSEELPELKNFILPKGSKAVTLAHVCRTVCRRAEIAVLDATELKNAVRLFDISTYLNRLSDFFFVLARYIGHKENINETIWENQNK